MIATLRYADQPSVKEEQFPLLVAQHRHELLNQKRSLYALRLDPSRRLLSVELSGSQCPCAAGRISSCHFRSGGDQHG